MGRCKALWAWCLATSICAAPVGHAQTTKDDPRLREGLKRYPEADADGDGVLTMKEGQAFLAKRGMTAAEALRTPDAGRANALAADVADVAYGPHERCRLDLYLPQRAASPTPLVVLIHGGGFKQGDKRQWATNDVTRELLDKGVACAAINYPFVDSMPIQDVLRQCGRAVQFLRAHADEWRLDPTRVAIMGGSAGAGTALWLATRDDLADPAASDPVLRESTRPMCAVCYATQATYNFSRWESFLGDFSAVVRDSDAEAARFYHLPSIESLESDRGRAIREECDMLRWITADDPPLLLDSPETAAVPTTRSHVVHSIKHARAVRAECAADGVECIVRQDHPGPPPRAVEFLLAKLRAAGHSTATAP
ncbi:MAG: alpha/beta hydrolase [Planctomycetia bacterium]|nr:alpha/beta hydrolase [Planctomycetia bacterium]